MFETKDHGSDNRAKKSWKHKCKNPLSRFASSQGLSQAQGRQPPRCIHERARGRRAQQRCSALRPWPRRTALAPRYPPCDCPRPRHRTATPSSPCALTPLLRGRLLQVGRCSLRKRVPIRGGIKDEVRAPRILSTHASTPALGLVISPPPHPLHVPETCMQRVPPSADALSFTPSQV